MKTVECVPNFSEGRNSVIIKKISEAAGSVPGARLLGVDPGIDTNRTVYTLAGEPEAVLTAAFEAIKRGSDLIDMSSHSGTHPRIGACDVCPFVPVSGVTIHECADLARRLGQKVGEELGIPVFLYERAASSPGRINLADIRSGEYEGLEEKMKDPEWKPDFGPAEYSVRTKKTGAAVIGAREFLIAYNINLQSKDKNQASAIAGRIREKGVTIKDEQGRPKKIPGRLRHCKAIGWYVDEYKKAQVSVNLTDFHVTNLHHAFEAAKEEGSVIGVRITGSQIVGLVPKQALIEAGLFYMNKSGQAVSASEKESIDAAVRGLGLNDAVLFDPGEKIIEYRLVGRFS